MPEGVGIDVGAGSVKLVKARVEGRRVQVLRAFKAEYPSQNTHAGGDLVDLPPALAEQIQQAGLAGRGVLGVSGRELMLRYATVPPAPPWRLREIMKFEVEHGPMGGAEELCSDYRILSMPGRGLADQLVTLLAVAKAKWIGGWLERLQKLKLTVNHCVPAALALYQAYRVSNLSQEDETAFLMDVGHDRIELAIVCQGELIFARTMPGGGRKFTAAIDALLKIGDKKAAAYKHERVRLGAAPPTGDDRHAKAMFLALSRPANELVSAINNGVRYCQQQANIRGLKLDRVILSGGGARLDGLPEYLEKKLNKPVVALDLSSALDLRDLDTASAAALSGVPADMAVPLGLAVCDADENAFSLELVPVSVQRRRRFLRKTIYGYAAVVIAALLGVLMAIRARSEVQAAGQATKALQSELQKYRQAEQKHEKFVAETLTLQRKDDSLRRQTRFGLAALELLRQLRRETPEGITLTRVAPMDEQDDSFAGRFTLRISGRSTLKESDVAAFVQGLAKDNTSYPFVEKTGGLTKIAADRDDSPGVQRFSFTVLLHSGFSQASVDSRNDEPW